MRSWFSTVQCRVVLICLTQNVAWSDKSMDIPDRLSGIDKFIPDRSDPMFTTRNYDDSIEPLSIENDGAPNCAPVVYGDQSDVLEDQRVTQDAVVRKLREEWIKKHGKETPAPAGGAKNEGAVFPDKGWNGHGLGNSEPDIHTDAGVRKLREEWLKKHKKEVNLHDQVRKDEVGNNEKAFNEEFAERLNEIDLVKKNHMLEQNGNAEHVHREYNGDKMKDANLKQHWNADDIHGGNKEEKKKNEILKQHWNAGHVHGDFKEDKTKLDVGFKKGIYYKKRMTLIPGEIDKSDPGYKHDTLQREVHEEIYGDTGVEGKGKVEIISERENRLKAKNSDQYNVYKVNRIHNHLKTLFNIKEGIKNNKENFISYKKLMNIELKETTNPDQHDKLYGPACGLKKLSKTNEKSCPDRNKKLIKNNRKKRNVHSTKIPLVHSIKRHRTKKTTKYFMDIDGRFRDIDEVEEERNKYSSELMKQTTPEWLNYDGYVEPKTAVKFRPRPTLNYNRVPKEPLDYGSYDKSEHWRMLTELIPNGTLPANFYEQLSEPELPNTQEAVDVCQENYTTSECFRYPDLSRLRDTKEKKFMKKYYHKDYPDVVGDD